MRSILFVIGSCVRGLRALRRDRNANVTVLTALTAPILVGFVGLAIDASTWSNAKSSVQGAADQAALSAATAAMAGGSSIQNEVTSVAKLNGYANGVNGAVVTYTELTTGAYTTTAPGYQVVITQSQNLYFSSIFLSTPPTVSGRSVAKASTPPCILALGTSGAGIAASGGSTTISATKCDVDVDSSSASALTLSGGSSLTATDLNIMGSYQTSGGSYIGGTTKINPNTSVKNPYNLSVPTFSGCDQTNYGTSVSATISPGVYCGGISVNGGSSHLTINPGTYIINGGSFNVSAGSVSGSGVTIVLTNKTGTWGIVNVSGGGTLNLSAPSSGTMQGVVIFMDPNAPSQTNYISGGSNLSIVGSVDLPSQILNFSGGSSTGTSCLQLIAASFVFSGGSSLGRSCGSTVVPGFLSAGTGVPAE
jgi:Flp pilus assembly protein TadG